MAIIFMFYISSGKITILSFTERFEIETRGLHIENYNGSVNGVGELV